MSGLDKPIADLKQSLFDSKSRNYLDLAPDNWVTGARTTNRSVWSQIF